MPAKPMATRRMPTEPACPAATHEVLATLQIWFSPAFPTGGFAYSQGLETCVAEGWLRTEADLVDWQGAILRRGSGWTDAVLFRAAHGASDPTLCEVSELALALAPSRARSAESRGQGEAFVLALRAGWPELLDPTLPSRPAFSVAAGAATGRLGASAEDALVAYLTGWAANLVGAGVRLGLCGQVGGMRVLRRLLPSIAQTAWRASRSTLDDLGVCAFGADVAAMRHEALSPRLFLS